MELIEAQTLVVELVEQECEVVLDEDDILVLECDEYILLSQQKLQLRDANHTEQVETRKRNNKQKKSKHFFSRSSDHHHTYRRTVNEKT